MSEKLVFELQAVDRATAPLKSVQDQLDRTGAATKRLAGQLNSTTFATRKFALGGLQQLGYQIGDYAVQVANGTSKMQAFGQQAPQILQVFGPLGAVIGAAVAIFAAMAVAADRASGSARNLKDSMSNLGNAAKAFADANELSLVSMRALEEQFGRNASAVRDLYTAQLQLAKSDMAKAQIDVVAKLRDSAAEILRLPMLMALPFQKAKMVQQDITNATAALKANFGATAQEALALDAALKGVSEALGPDQLFATAKALQSAIMSFVDESGRIPPELDEAYRNSILLQQAAISAGLAIADAADAGKILNDTNMSDGLSSALSVAQQLALATREALFPTAGRRGDPRDFVNDKYYEDKFFPDPEKYPPDPVAGANDPMKTLREQLALETELLGKTEAQQRVIQALGLDYKKYGDTALNSLVEQITKMDQLNKLAEQQKEIASTIRSAFSSAFMSMVDGTKSAKDAFREMARDIVAKLYEILVVEQLVDSISGVVGKAFPALAPALAGAKAMGGPVTGGQPYLVGEKGPEIIVPSRNSHVIPNSGVNGGAVIVNQTINISTGVQQTVRAEVQSLLPQISDAAKAAMLDARRRGGVMRSTFG